MSNLIRVGILGCAQIAKRSLASAFLSHPAFELVACASRDLKKASEFINSLSPRFDVSRLRAVSYSDLVSATDVDLVYCPLPNGLHFEWVVKLLKAGKHVLCEKSLGCNYREVTDMIALARAEKRFLMESFQFRFHAQNTYVKELLDRREIGDLRQLIVRFGIPPFSDGAKNIRYQKNLGGGALLDNGAYTVKCSTYLLGANVRPVAALFGGAKPELGNVDLTGALMLVAVVTNQAGGQTEVPIQTAYGFDHFYQNGYEIWGTEGKITTIRAFTARDGFAAPVILEKAAGRTVNTFNDDHFAKLLDYLAQAIPAGEYETEYQECLQQAKILDELAKLGGLT